MSQVYIYKETQQLGPFSQEQILDLVENKHFTWDDLAWHEGMAEWEPLQAVLERLPPPLSAQPVKTVAPSTEPRFHHVAPAKFILMTFITLGLYQLYWFYRGWRYLKQRDGESIWPFWRAFFAPVWFFPFASRVFEEQRRPNTGLAASLAAGYLLVTITWRLPDPYWLISFASFLFVLPVVASVHHLNQAQGTRGVAYRRFGVLHGLTAIVVLPLAAFTFASIFHLIPSGQAVEGKSVPAYHQKYLRDAGMLPADEEIVYFYSTGFLDYRTDGSFFTPGRVVRYWEDFDGEWLEEALMSDVTEIVPIFSTGFYEETIITITRADGSFFDLYVSAAEEKDHLFYQSLKQHWERAKTVVGAID